MVLEKCRKNYRQAANTCAERYSNHERKSHMTFKRLSECFIVYNTVKEKKRIQRKTANDELLMMKTQ